MLDINDLNSLYILAQHGVAVLFQRTEATLTAAQAAAQAPPAPPVDSTPPAA